MASRSLGTLTLDLVAKIGGFVAGMSQAERAADTKLRAIERRATKFANVIGSALGLSISGALTAGVVAIDRAIDRMDSLRDASIRLGIGVETLSAFDYAAQQTGTSIDELGKSLKILAKNMADAGKEGSSKNNLFEALGVQIADAEGNLRDFEDVIPEIADAFAQLEDGVTKAALAQELFGKSGLSMIEFLSEGGDGIRKLTDEAKALGVTFDRDAADKADKLNDEIAKLKATFLGLATDVVVELLPDLIKLVEGMRSFATEAGGSKIIADELRAVIKGLGEIAQLAGASFRILSSSAKGIGNDLLAVANGLQAIGNIRGFNLSAAKENLEEARQYLKDGQEYSKDAKKAWEDLAAVGTAQQAAIKANTMDMPQFRIPGLDKPGENLWSAVPDAEKFSAVPIDVDVNLKPKVDVAAVNRALAGITDPKDKKEKKGGKSDAEKLAEDAKRAAAAAREEIDRLNAGYRESIALFGETSEAAKLRYQFEQEDISKLDAATQGYIQSQRQIAINNAELLDQKRIEAEVQQELDRINEQRQKNAEQVLADIQSQRDLLGQTAEAQDTYNKLAYAGVSANSALGQAISEANKSLHEQAKAVADQIELMDAVRDAGADVLVGLVDAARGAADAWDVLRDAIDNVAGQLTRMIAENLMEKAFGERGSTSGGSAGDWFGKALGWLFGAMGSGGGTSTAVGPRAIGGMAEAGGVYRINENARSGPEMLSFGGKQYLMMAGSAGFVRAPDPVQHSSGMGFRAFQPIFNIQGRPDRSTLKQIERASGAGARREIGRTGNF